MRFAAAETVGIGVAGAAGRSNQVQGTGQCSFQGAERSLQDIFPAGIAVGLLCQVGSFKDAICAYLDAIYFLGYEA